MGLVNIPDPLDVNPITGQPNNYLRATMPYQVTHLGRWGYTNRSGPRLCDYAELEGVVADHQQRRHHRRKDDPIKVPNLTIGKWDGDPDTYQDFIYDIRGICEMKGRSNEERFMILNDSLIGDARQYVGKTNVKSATSYASVIATLYNEHESKGRLVEAVKAYIKHAPVKKTAAGVAQLYRFLDTQLRILCLTPLLSEYEANQIVNVIVRKICELGAATEDKLNEYELELEKEGMSVTVWDLRRFLDLRAGTLNRAAAFHIDYDKRAMKRWSKDKGDHKNITTNLAEAEEKKSAEEEMEATTLAVTTRAQRRNEAQRGQPRAGGYQRKPVTQCPACGDPKHLNFKDCSFFPKLIPRARAAIVMTTPMCRVCLAEERGASHTLESCPAPSCSDCSNRHHQSLCYAIRDGTKSVNLLEVNWEEAVCNFAMADSEAYHDSLIKKEKEPEKEEKREEKDLPEVSSLLADVTFSAAPQEDKDEEEELEEVKALIAEVMLSDVKIRQRKSPPRKLYAMTFVCWIMYNGKCQKHRVRALVDTGSDVTFIRRGLFEKLGLQGEVMTMTVTGVNGYAVQTKEKKAVVELMNPMRGEVVSMKVYTRDRITNKNTTIDDEELEKMVDSVKELQPDYGFGAGSIDLLIGQAELTSIMKGYRKLTEKSGMHDTRLGGALSGPLAGSQEAECGLAEKEQD
jgi:hypothetical protein